MQQSILYPLVILFLLSGLSACKKDDPQPTRKQLTTGVWKINNVMVDNVNQTENFTGMTLEFNETSFNSVNGNVVWPETGIWGFTDDRKQAFVRDDGVVVTILAINSGNLVLALTWDKTTLGGGRIKSIGGDYTFEFTK
jgi:hypothetical protein